MKGGQNLNNPQLAEYLTSQSVATVDWSIELGIEISDIGHGAGATGDGIVLAENVGAGLVDVDQIQTSPTVEQATSEVISETIRVLGAIFVNQAGVRFTSEMEIRDILSSKNDTEFGRTTSIDNDISTAFMLLK